jgi:hypothetical protein
MNIAARFINQESKGPNGTLQYLLFLEPGEPPVLCKGPRGSLEPSLILLLFVGVEKAVQHLKKGTIIFFGKA